jgi:cation diffusion facilitator CzcD-associated flavoprotein CzcO
VHRGKYPWPTGFQGEWYHTGHWPHEGVDLTWTLVGMIGTESTGIEAGAGDRGAGEASDGVSARR